MVFAQLKCVNLDIMAPPLRILRLRVKQDAKEHQLVEINTRIIAIKLRETVLM